MSQCVWLYQSFSPDNQKVVSAKIPQLNDAICIPPCNHKKRSTLLFVQNAPEAPWRPGSARTRWRPQQLSIDLADCERKWSPQEEMWWTEGKGAEEGEERKCKVGTRDSARAKKNVTFVVLLCTHKNFPRRQCAYEMPCQGISKGDNWRC